MSTDSPQPERPADSDAAPASAPTEPTEPIVPSTPTVRTEGLPEEPRRRFPLWATITASVAAGVVVLGIGFAGGVATGLLIPHGRAAASAMMGSHHEQSDRGDRGRPQGPEERRDQLQQGQRPGQGPGSGLRQPGFGHGQMPGQGQTPGMGQLPGQGQTPRPTPGTGTGQPNG